MFRRREKQSSFHSVRNLVWPVIGWRRTVNYWGHRIGRRKGSTYSLAAGFACGAAVSFTPLIGLHILFGAFLAWVMRANIWASVIGTAVGNPWTFPFIWIWTYRLGVWMGVGGAREEAERLDFTGIFGRAVGAMLRLDWGYLFETAWPVLGPMLAGGLPSAVVAWLISYFSIRAAVDGYRVARENRIIMAKQADAEVRQGESR